MRVFRLLEVGIAAGILAAFGLGFCCACFLLIHAKLAAAGWVVPLAGRWF